jgi:hypothetical protein
MSWIQTIGPVTAIAMALGFVILASLMLAAIE